jgi:hypothetical protein
MYNRSCYPAYYDAGTTPKQVILKRVQDDKNWSCLLQPLYYSAVYSINFLLHSRQ